MAAGVRRMQLDTLRVVLIKVGGRVRQLLTKARFHLASGHPGQRFWYALVNNPGYAKHRDELSRPRAHGEYRAAMNSSRTVSGGSDLLPEI